jgi:hypothetical protein
MGMSVNFDPQYKAMIPSASSELPVGSVNPLVNVLSSQEVDDVLAQSAVPQTDLSLNESFSPGAPSTECILRNKSNLKDQIEVQLRESLVQEQRKSQYWFFNYLAVTEPLNGIAILDYIHYSSTGSQSEAELLEALEEAMPDSTSRKQLLVWLKKNDLVDVEGDAYSVSEIGKLFLEHISMQREVDASME